MDFGLIYQFVNSDTMKKWSILLTLEILWMPVDLMPLPMPGPKKPLLLCCL